MNKFFFIEIDPKEIKHFPTEDFKSLMQNRICKGIVAGCPSQILGEEYGDWDKDGYLFERNGYWKTLTSFLTDFSSVDRHDVDIVDLFQKHDLYKFELETLREGNELTLKKYNRIHAHARKRLMSPRWGNEKGFLAYEEFVIAKVRGFLDLYHSIKDNGFLSNVPDPESDDNIKAGTVLPSSNPLNYGPINISMGREKTFLQNNGFHRLTVCQFLDISKIPVKVLAIHKERYEREKLHITERTIP